MWRTQAMMKCPECGSLHEIEDIFNCRSCGCLCCEDCSEGRICFECLEQEFDEWVEYQLEEEE